MLKNTAGQQWQVFAFDAGGQPVEDDQANITATIKLDAASPVATNDINPSQADGKDGYYLFDLTAAETNANQVWIYPVSSTPGVTVIGVPGNESPIPRSISAVLGASFQPNATGNTAGPSTLNLNAHVRGDTWNGISPIAVVDGQGGAVSLAGATIRMHVRKNRNQETPDLSLEIGDGITVIDEPGGIFEIDKQIIDLQPDPYEYDIEVELADSDIYTIIEGRWTILQDVTR